MKYYSIYIFLFGLFITNNASSQQFSVISGDELFQNAEYRAAAAVYGQELYYLKNDQQRASLFFKRIKALMKAQDYLTAAKEASSARRFSSDSLSASAIYLGAYNYFLGSNYPLAQFQLQRLEVEYPQFFLEEQVKLKLLLLVKLKDDSVSSYLTSAQVAHFADTNALKQWFHKYNNAKFKKPTTAEWLSTFAPGLGQVYAGRFVEGVASFTLNAAALGFMGYNFWLTNYITTFSVGSALLNKFFFGGRRRAHFLAEAQNKKVEGKLLKELVETINKKGSR